MVGQAQGDSRVGRHRKCPFKIAEQIFVQNVQTFSAFFNPPPRRGGGNRWGLELSAAVERLERFERRVSSLPIKDILFRENIS
jgi:hypothetical protein